MRVLDGLSSSFEDYEVPNFTDDERRRFGAELKALRRRILAGPEKDTEKLEG